MLRQQLPSLMASTFVLALGLSACRAQEHSVLQGSFGKVLTAASDPEGKVFVSSHGGSTLAGIVKVWNLKSLKQTNVLEDTGDVSTLALAPNGDLLATVKDDMVTLWNTTSSKKVRTLKGQTGKLQSIDFDPSGKMLAAAGDNGTILLYNVETGATQATLRHSPKGVVQAAFSPDGSLLASAGQDGTVQLWEVASASRQSTLRGHAGPIQAIAFAPDGASLATVGKDGTARVWDVATGAERTVFRGHKGPVFSAYWSPDGRMLVTLGEDGTARLWDVKKAELRHTFQKQGARASAAAFSPSSKRVVVCLGDQVTVHDTATLRRLAVLKGNKGQPQILDFTPDGKTLIGAGDERDVQVWTFKKDRE